ncbi:hypothetical protein [Flavisphingomonas formosensis]|uniref:hypothetical protein n=1 Tax=Flavisphingomonas formosensis TaxID=861534 RepID=UPI0012FB5E97|nr:hypothetical protein [Sphingomonas formosensis]
MKESLGDGRVAQMIQAMGSSGASAGEGALAMRDQPLPSVLAYLAASAALELS